MSLEPQANKTMTLPLSILLVRSRRTGRQYYVGIPSADVDYVTDGLLVLTSKEKNEIVLTMATSEEYSLGLEEAGRRCATRLQEKLRREDLAAVVLNLDIPALKAVWRGRGGSAWRFAFTDIYDPGDFADPVSALSHKEYVSSGGVVTDLRNEG
jgi:hypothetical protein